MNNAEEYSNACDLQYRDARDVVEEFQHEMSRMKGKCIDIGCGPGDVSRKLILENLGKDAELVGADISKAMIDCAKRKHQNEKRMSFIQLDIEDNIPNDQIGQYDNLLSFYCLHWCQDHRRTFGNIYKLLRPGGRGLVMFLCYNTGFDTYTKVQDPRYRPYTQDAERFVPYFQKCKEDARAAFRKALEGAGFEVLHCSRREKGFVYKNQETFKRHMIAVNPFIPRMPADLKEEYGDVLVREMLSEKIFLPNKNGDNQSEPAILDMYHLLVAYFVKPL